MSFRLHSGAKHKLLGFCNVVNQEPNPAGQIQVKPEDSEAVAWVHPTELEQWPTDINHRNIKLGDIILCPVPGIILQGVVETIKWGKHSGGYNQKVIRIGIRDDRTGHIKSTPYAEQCIIIEKRVIKQERV